MPARSREATVLRLADGEGCVRLHDADVVRRALLLERLGPSMYDLGVPRRRRHELLVDAVLRVWRPVDSAPVCRAARTGRAGSSDGSSSSGARRTTRARNACSSTRSHAPSGAPRRTMTI